MHINLNEHSKKMKLIKLINARSVIVQHAREKLPVQTAYKLIKFLKSTDNDEIFYNEKRRDIINQYAEKDKEGNLKQKNGMLSWLPGKEEACNNELIELNDTQVELPPIKFTIDELGGLQLSVKDVFDIEELLIEEG